MAGGLRRGSLGRSDRREGDLRVGMRQVRTARVGGGGGELNAEAGGRVERGGRREPRVGGLWRLLHLRPHVARRGGLTPLLTLSSHCLLPQPYSPPRHQPHTYSPSRLLPPPLLSSTSYLFRTSLARLPLPTPITTSTPPNPFHTILARTTRRPPTLAYIVNA